MPEFIGYVRTPRSIQSNWIWKADKKFSRYQAWEYLVLNASYNERSFYMRGILVNLLPGQIAKGYRELAKEWGWNVRTVMRFISVLEKQGNIAKSATDPVTVITINNWNDYGMGTTQSATQSATQNTTQSATPNKNIKNINNIKKENTTKQDFGDSQTKPLVRKPKKPQIYKPVDSNFLLEMRKKFPGVDIEKFWEDVQTKQRLKGVEIKNERLTLFNWLTNDKKWSEERQHPQEKLYYADAKTRDGRIVKLKSNAPILPGAYFNGDDGMVIVS